jgi:hypothetical protein
MLADQFAAVAGFPGIGSYTGAEVPAGTLPMWANFTINGQTITAGSVRFDGAMHTMVGYVEEDSSWETVVSPYRARPTKVTITNPTPAVQKQLQIFFASRFTEGRARIAAD